MKLQLENLKTFLISNNVKSFLQIKDKNIIKNINEIVNKENSKTFTPKTLIKLLLNESNYFCECGKNLRKFDANTNKFRANCKLCKKHVESHIIKNTRLKEKIYNGDFYNIEEVILFLSGNFEKYLTKGAQRRLIKENPKLYFSILKFSEEIDNIKGVTIRARVLFLLNNDISKCKCGNNVKMFDVYNGKFYPCCKNCIPKRSSLKYYKLFYPNDFEKKFSEDRKKRIEASKNLHTKKWYIEKYGETEGLAKYNHHCERMLSTKKSTSHSKISLTLFNNLLLYGYYDAEFAKHPKEKMFILDDIYSKKIGQTRIFVDFCYKNKIIEFQGNYWHKKNNNKDLLRKKYLNSIGYDVLFIYENDYKKDNLSELKKCLRFLEENVVQNRFQILGESGYIDFDNIIELPKTYTLKFKTQNNEICVSENHIFYNNKKEIIANTLKVGDSLQTKNGNEKILSIEKDNSVVYDVLETKDHTYFANNILNHNCEFIGSSYTLVSAAKLQEMKEKDIQEIRDGKLKIYEYPEEKHQYIMSVDAAKDGSDSFAVQVVDITDFNFKQVASAKLQIDYLLMPEFINEWCEYYNKPYLIIENNEGAGQSIADQMYLSYEYENLHFDKDVGRNKKKKYPGFRTTTKSRKQILQTLKLFIENDKLSVIDKSTINEFLTFILSNNKFQADDGYHDDMIMALALIFVPFCNTKNFEDMKKVVANLYDDDMPDDEKVNFGEMLTIGSFDSGTDEDYLSDTQREYISIEDAIADYEGFI